MISKVCGIRISTPLSGIKFDVLKWSASFWHILPPLSHLVNITTCLSDSSFQIYTSDDKKRLSALSPTRLYDLSRLLSDKQMDDVVSGNANLPGKHSTILVEGYFCNMQCDSSSACLIGTRGENINMAFNSFELVKRLLNSYGDRSSPSVFQIERVGGSRFFLRGTNPSIFTLDSPAIRDINPNYYTLLKNRFPKQYESEEIRMETRDAIGLMRKGSESSSSNSSASAKASIGLHSIDTSFPLDIANESHMEYLTEMKRNSLVLDKTRFLILSSSLIQRIISLFHISGVLAKEVDLYVSCDDTYSLQDVRIL
jgi:hypothetical protein